jgi:ribonuclease J
MWDGYLEQPGGRRMRNDLSGAGVPLVHHHASGHATTADLVRLAAAIDPAVVVPIHTEAPDRYAAVLGRRVTLQPDGAWWDIPARRARTTEEGHNNG